MNKVLWNRLLRQGITQDRWSELKGESLRSQKGAIPLRRKGGGGEKKIPIGDEQESEGRV